jgi:hypothetical protein
MATFRIMRSALGQSVASASVPMLFVLLFGVASFLTFGPRGSGVGRSSELLELANWTGPLLWTSVAIGFAVMACIQLFKPEIRSVFHNSAIAQWLDIPPRAFPPGTLMSEIGMGRSGNAALELPIEQLVAQIQAAAEVELSSSSPYPIQERSRLIKAILKSKADYPDSVEAPNERARLSYLVQRRLDELQIEVRHDWRRLLRFLALTVSLVFTSALAAAFRLWVTNPLGTAFVVLLLTLLGAFFASAARDLIAAVERLRA